MSAGGARRGRRDNGLDATEYAVAGDVDPRVGEHLLDVLAAGGIAAYLQPSADLNPVTRDHHRPGPAHRPALRRPEPPGHRPGLPGPSSPTRTGPPAPPPPARTPDRPADVDAEWARIVAGYHTAVDPTAAPWPAAEDVDAGRAPTTRRTRPGRTDPAGARRAGQPGRARGTPAAVGHRLLRHLASAAAAPTSRRCWTAWTPSAPTCRTSPSERYTPPPPPPLPRLSKYAVVGVLARRRRVRCSSSSPTLLPIDRSLVTLLGFTGDRGRFRHADLAAAPRRRRGRLRQRRGRLTRTSDRGIASTADRSAIT